MLGTFGNCSGGTTPWGTVLSGEENFNGYFDKSGDLDPRYAASYARYGLNGSGRGWKDVDPRFDLTTEPHEPFRFGWIVEVDPLRPESTPRKLSMLGRFKHEGANVAIAPGGRAVVYMGDDERGDYMYKFVSRDKVDSRRPAPEHGVTTRRCCRTAPCSSRGSPVTAPTTACTTAPVSGCGSRPTRRRTSTA